jgi:uncharacterized protein (TIGR00730 family)
MRAICVYCGASPGADPDYAISAIHMGEALARQGIRLVFGGGGTGMMGKVADGALAAGGEVIGVIPRELVARELAHQGLTELKVVQDMHERKATMAELSDAFVALPGGLGTLEELFEMLTWAQLRFHAKPCGVLNVNGYYDGLLRFMDHQMQEGFLRPPHRRLLQVASEPDALIAELARHAAG